MSTITAELKKLDAAAKKATADQGTGALPDGQYRGLVTKGTIDMAREGKAMSATWRVRVLEGDSKGCSGRINQNIRKKDGTPNDTGLSIVKGILTQIHGEEEMPADAGTGSWEKLMAESVGATLLFTVTTRDDQSNSRVQGVFPKTDTEEPAATVETEEEEVVEEEEEPTPKGKKAAAPAAEEEEEDDVPTPKASKKAKAAPAEETEEQKLERWLTEKTEAGDRAGLKEFIKANELNIKVMKSWTEEDIASHIRKEMLQAEA